MRSIQICTWRIRANVSLTCVIKTKMGPQPAISIQKLKIKLPSVPTGKHAVVESDTSRHANLSNLSPPRKPGSQRSLLWLLVFKRTFIPGHSQTYPQRQSEPPRPSCGLEKMTLLSTALPKPCLSAFRNWPGLLLLSFIYSSSPPP